MGEWVRRRVERPRGPVLVNVKAAGAHHAILRLVIQELLLQAKAIRMADVIGVHTGHQRRAGFSQQLIEAGNQPPVLAKDRADALVYRGIGRDDVTRGVARSVIENQKLEIIEALTEHAFYRLREEALAIIDAHSNANGWGRRRGHKHGIRIILLMWRGIRNGDSLSR